MTACNFATIKGNKTMAFGADTTTDEVLDGIDMTGRRVLITGASGGLGEETARAMASKGAIVTITARDMAKGEAVAEKIRKSTGNPNIDVRELELSVPDSVRAFAAGYLADHDSLDLLINNAGVMARPLGRTVEGWEMQFATNHIGHFLLTNLLISALKKSAADGRKPRIVNLSSAAHRFGTVDFDDIHFDNREYDKWGAYGQSKTANVLFSVELNKRLADDGITANALHPGGIMTDLGRHLSPEDIADLMSRRPVGDDGNEVEAEEVEPAEIDPENPPGIKMKTIPAGAATTCWGATAAELEGKGGLYLDDCQIGDPADYAIDPEGASKLWAVTEEILGEKFDL